VSKNLCIFGDSIAWGEGDIEGGGWVDRLKLYFQKTDPEVLVHNQGVQSDNTDGLLQRFAPEAIARRCTIALFAIGINDSQMLIEGREQRMGADDFRINVLDLIAQAQALDLQIAFIGLTRVDESKTRPIPWRPDIHYVNDRISTFDAVIKDICDEKELPYLDVSQILTIEDMPDGLHPNVLGHEKLLGEIYPYIEARLGL